MRLKSIIIFRPTRCLTIVILVQNFHAFGRFVDDVYAILNIDVTSCTSNYGTEHYTITVDNVNIIIHFMRSKNALDSVEEDNRLLN